MENAWIEMPDGARLASRFCATAQLIAREDGEEIARRDWTENIPRDLNRPQIRLRWQAGASD